MSKPRRRALCYAAMLWMILALPATAGEFLWLSDIHFDPLADRALVDRLAATEPSQWAGILAGGSQAFPAYGRDTNWALFSSLLEASRRAQPKPAFTIVTGDLLVHHFREQFDAAAAVHDDQAFRSFVRKSMEFVGLQLQSFSPGTPVFFALGNNDDECADYAIQPGGPFLQDTAKMSRDLARLADSASYENFGSYSALNPAVKNGRIIVLDTVFFSPRYRNLCGSPAEDPGDKLLAWLDTQLQEAQARHEKVWLVYHIPPGVDAFATARASSGAVTLLWKEPYAQKFIDILRRYPGIMGPNFAGHIHVDDFRLLGGPAKATPFIVTAPAVSPITRQNPSFRFVRFNSRGTIEDQSTYVLKNLHETASGAAPRWELEYDFEKEWHVHGMNAQSYGKLFAQAGRSAQAEAHWTALYSTSNPAGSSVTPANFRQFYCAAGNVSAQAYQACVAQGRPHDKAGN